jgi:hypothetical protein
VSQWWLADSKLFKTTKPTSLKPGVVGSVIWEPEEEDHLNL